MVQVSIIIGSSSDLEIAEKTTKILEDFGVSYDLQVISAHRNPERLREYVYSSEAKVFVCIAGLAAALPGVVAAHTIKPVIGVPKNAALGGLDALLSIVQMPTGIPVATVGINRGQNAAILAIQILALNNDILSNKINEYREKQSKK
jgi:5-(carboxyamino)imidazole ribonucleotide mutase